MKYDENGRLIPLTDKQAMSLSKKWVIGTCIALPLLGAGIWGIGVATSGTHGRGEQIKKINRADNRTFAQEQFHQLYQDVQAYDQQIAVQQSALDAHKTQDAEHDRLAQVVAGIKTQCISTRQQYNAEAQKISKRSFLDSGLPAEIDDSSPATDCK